MWFYFHKVNVLMILQPSLSHFFSHFLSLIKAEKARLEGKDLEAISFFQKAIKNSSENEFIYHEAMANELLSQFWFTKG